MNKEYYDVGNGQLSKAVIEAALNRLGELLKDQNKRVELVVAGGIISVLYFGSRLMTRDIDAIIPEHDKVLLARLINQVAAEQMLPTGKHAWLNDSVSFFGLQTKSTNVIFKHSNLSLFSATWHELLGMKLSGAWRRDTDFNDAVHILREIGSNTKHHTLLESLKYKNFAPFTDDETFTKRFERIWQAAFGVMPKK